MSQNTVLVTGGCRGFGLVLANCLFQAGFKVSITCTNPSNHSGPLTDHFEILGIDLSVEAEVAKLCNWITSTKPKFLINNAAFYHFRENYKEYNFKNLSKVMSVNFAAPLILTEAFANIVRKQDSQYTVINISSVSVKHGGSPLTIDYTASKSALEVMTRSLARKYARKNIAIISLRLGIMETDLQTRNKSKRLEERIKLVPTERFVDTSYAAGFIKYILEYSSMDITGSIIDITGGE